MKQTKKRKERYKRKKKKKGGIVISRDLLEPALAMLALVSHPALVADTGGIDTMTREAGDFVAGLGLGHLGVEGQVQEAVEEQPAVHVQERGEAAAGGGRERSPGAQGRGGSSRSPGSAARVHLRRGGHGPRSGRQRWQRPPRRNNPAREIQTPRFLLAGLSSLPTPALPPPRPVTPEGKPGSPQPPTPSLRRPPQGSSLPSSSMEEEESCFLTLCFLLTRYAPHRRVRTYTHTHHPPPCSPRLPLLLCSRCARGSRTLTHTHAGRRQREERREAGAAAVLSPLRWEARAAEPRSRYGIPHQRGREGTRRRGEG